MAHTGDCISLGSLELSPGDVAGVQIPRSWEALALVKSLDGGNNLKKMSRKAIRASSTVGLLSMPDIDAASFLKGGRAVQLVWLMATRLGIAFHPMTALPYLLTRLTVGGGHGLGCVHHCGVVALLPRYRALFAAPGAHVMLFRLAMADAASERALRRPVHECFVER